MFTRGYKSSHEAELPGCHKPQPGPRASCQCHQWPPTERRPPVEVEHCQHRSPPSAAMSRNRSNTGRNFAVNIHVDAHVCVYVYLYVRNMCIYIYNVYMYTIYIYICIYIMYICMQYIYISCDLRAAMEQPALGAGNAQKRKASHRVPCWDE